MSVFTTVVNNNFQPGIVREGATLILDAGDPKSYTSGSTTWNDLSGYGNHCTFSGSMQNLWTSTFGGYFDFVNNYNQFGTIAQAPSINNTYLRDFTTEVWWTVDAAAGGSEDNIGPWGKQTWSTNPSFAILSNRNSPSDSFAGVCSFTANTTFYRGGSNDAASKIWPSGYTGGFVTNAWSCTQFVRRGNTLSLFSNLRNCWDTSYTVNLSNTQNLIIGRPRSDNATFGYEMDGKLMAVIWYDRALGLDELRQNYNTMAQRVGLRLSPF